MDTDYIKSIAALVLIWMVQNGNYFINELVKGYNSNSLLTQDKDYIYINIGLIVVVFMPFVLLMGGLYYGMKDDKGGGPN